MNKPGTLNIEGALDAPALGILRAVPGLTAVAKPTDLADGINAVLQFGANRTPIAIEFKHRANAATAWQLVHLARARPGTPVLLIAGETTAEARTILQDHGIGVIDGLGNVHVELPGLLFHLEGPRRRRERSTSPARLQGKAGVVAQALLLDPERAWHIKELANEAHVSAALVHRVFKRLQDEGTLAAEGAGPNRVRRVVDPTALLDLWAEENTNSPSRTLAFRLAQNTEQLTRNLAASLARSGIDYALTGGAACGLVAPFITAVPVVEVWVMATSAPAELHHATEAEPVSEGHNVVFLQAKDDSPLVFREKAHGLWIANRFRLYADLRRDPRRGREQAEHLRQEVIGF